MRPFLERLQLGKGITMSVFTRPKKVRKGQQKRWHYEFCVRGVRYRGALSEARTKWHAEQAETLIRQQVYEGKFSLVATAPRLADFIEEAFLPWSKANKSSWRNDVSRAKAITTFMGQKPMSDITPELIEKFKIQQYDSITCRGRRRSKASVNHDLELLSKMFSLAIKYKKVRTNPCRDVQRFRPDNIRIRYFSYDEEERLLAQCTDQRAHIKSIVSLGIGTGMRLGEILRLTKQQLDFERSVVIAMHTKTKQDRVIPMNSEIRAVLLDAYRKCGDEEYIFVNPTTGSRITEIKRSFTTALRLSGIKGATFHTTRHTFGTRLGDAGYNAFEIAELMGHSDIKTSQRYVHPTDARKRAAVESAKRWAQNSPHNSPTKHEQRSSLIAVSV